MPNLWTDACLDAHQEINPHFTISARNSPHSLQGITYLTAYGETGPRMNRWQKWDDRLGFRP